VNISSVNNYTQISQLSISPQNQNQASSNFDITDEVQISEQARLRSDEDGQNSNTTIFISVPEEPPI
jgi:hypothetical protein